MASSDEHVSNVNWRKVIDNFRSSYQSVSPAEILIVELVANSLDAGADEISVSVEGELPLIVTVTDNGRGMRSWKEFEEYHDLGSLTKIRGTGIGWAGVGAKLYIDRCSQIYTETHSISYTAASTWSFTESMKAPVWKDTESRRLVAKGYGTAVQISIVNREEAGRFTEEFVRDILLANYNYAMDPHGKAIISLNGQKVKPFNPADFVEKAFPVRVHLKEEEYAEGVFYLLREHAPPGFALVSVIVHGKTIGDQYDFKQFARIRDPELISGYIRCDPLIHITTTSKDCFNRKDGLWREFDKRVGKAFADWLEKEGNLEKARQDVGLEKLADQLSRDLNKIFHLREIRDMDLDLFQNITRRLTAIQDGDGKSKGILVEGKQTTTGTVGGPGTGSGVLTEGDEPGTGVRAEPNGSVRATERIRRVKGGIRLAYHAFPDRGERAWIDPALQAIVINTAHDAFKCAEILESIPYYSIDNCFAIVTETIDEEEKRQEVINRLFNAYRTLT